MPLYPLECPQCRAGPCLGGEEFFGFSGSGTPIPQASSHSLIGILGVRSSSCGRQSVDQFVWVSGLPLGPLTTFYLALLFSSDNYLILLSKASSLTRKRVCSLECLHSLVRSLTTNNHTLPSHLRLCSLFVSSYDSQGLRWRYSNPPPHGSLNFS
jgi:hypothetical protein